MTTPLPRMVRRDSGANVSPRLDSASAIHQKRDDSADQKYNEQDFRDARGACRNSAKSEQSGYQSNDQKHDSVVQHGRFLLYYRPSAISKSASDHTAPRSAPLERCRRTRRQIKLTFAQTRGLIPSGRPEVNSLPESAAGRRIAAIWRASTRRCRQLRVCGEWPFLSLQ
jgi:hypothetical protein